MEGYHPVYEIVKDKYQVLELIDQGTYGSVFKAEDITTKNTVAIKYIKIKADAPT